VPLTFSLVSFIGIIVSSSSVTIYGEAIWSPIDLLGKFLDDSPSHATRFGVSFSAGLRTFSHIFILIYPGLVHLCILHYRTGNNRFLFSTALTADFDFPFISLGNYPLIYSPFSQLSPPQDQHLSK
jgi:hypothetical protein